MVSEGLKDFVGVLSCCVWLFDLAGEDPFDLSSYGVRSFPASSLDIEWRELLWVSEHSLAHSADDDTASSLLSSSLLHLDAQFVLQIHKKASSKFQNNYGGDSKKLKNVMFLTF